MDKDRVSLHRRDRALGWCGVDMRPRWPIIAAMAKEKARNLRVGKIEVVKSITRRPKGLFRPDQVHKDGKSYDRTRAKRQLRKSLKEDS